MAEPSVAEFLIKIIVRAHNEAGNLLDKVDGQLNKVRQSTDKKATAEKRATAATKDHSAAVADLDERYGSFRKNLSDSTLDYDDATFSLKRYAKEMRELANKLPAGDETGLRLNRQAAGMDEIRKKMEAVRRQEESDHAAGLKRIDENKDAQADALAFIQGETEKARSERMAAEAREESAAAASQERSRRARMARIAEEMDEAHALREREKEDLANLDEDRDHAARVSEAAARQEARQDRIASARAKREREERHQANVDLMEEVGLTQLLAEAHEKIKPVQAGPSRYAEQDVFQARPTRAEGGDRAADERLYREEVKETIRVENNRIEYEARATEARQAARRKEAEELGRQLREEEAARKRLSTQILRDQQTEAQGMDRRITKEAEWRSEIRRNEAAIHDLLTAAAHVNPGTVDDDYRADLTDRLREHSGAARQAARNFPAGSDERTDARRISRNTDKTIRDVDSGVIKLGRSGNDTRGILAKMFDVQPRGGEQMTKLLERFEDKLHKSRASSVQFVAALRSIVIISVLSFLDQLIGVAVALLGTLVSLASAAVQAGIALAGMATAGVAQALPIIGLFAAAWGRVGAVFDAVKQQQKMATTATQDASAALKKQQDAADAVRSAQEQLASAYRGVEDANRNLTDAQEKLNEARRNAKDDLEDLIAAERAAELQRRAAELAQKDAGKALRRAIATGDVSQQDSLKLASDEADNNIGVTQRAATRATAERVRVGGDPEKLDSVKTARDGVENAERSLADARRAVTQASRGLQKARRDAADAGKETSAAATQLNNLLAQLSPAERRLYNALISIKKRFKDVFTGSGGVTESITNAFTYGVGRAESLLKDKKLIDAARGLSVQMSTQLRRIFDALSGPNARKFLVFFANEARRNLPVVTDLLLKMGRVFANIAKAASPAFRVFLRFLDDVASKWAKSTSSNSGMSKMERFFLKGEKYAESILKLAGAMARLFGAVMGAGASETGGTAIDKMVSKLNDATDWVNKNQPKVRKFFRDALDATGKVMWAVGTIAKALFGLFNPGQVKTFSEMIGNTLVPILENIFAVIGGITSAFDSVFGSGSGAKFAVFIASTLLINKLLASMLLGLGRIVIAIIEFTGATRLAAAAQFLLDAAVGPWLLAAVAIGVGVAMLDKKLHFIAPTLKFLGDQFKVVGNYLQKVWPSILAGAGKAIDAMVRFIKDALGGVGFAGVIGTPLRMMVRGIKVTIENVVDIFKTFVSVVKKIFKGDFKGAIGDVVNLTGRIFGRIGGAVWAGIKDVGKQIGKLPGLAGKALKGVWSFFKNNGKGIGKALLDGLWGGIKLQWKLFTALPEYLYDKIVKPILKFFGIASPSKRFAEIGKNLIRGLRDGVWSMVTGLGGFFLSVGEEIVKGIVKGIAKAPGALVGALKGLLGVGGKLAGKAVSGAKNLAGKAVSGAKGLFDKITGSGGDDDKKKQAPKSPSQTVTDTVASLAVISIDPKGMNDYLKAWQNFWKKMSGTSNDGTSSIEKQFRDMRVNTSRSADRMYRDIRGSLGDINKSFDVRGGLMQDSWSDAINGVSKVAFKGYDYIGHETNKILKSLGAKHINFGLSGPTAEKAEKKAIGGRAGSQSGYVGMQGERGADTVNTVLGRGEAVLNWGHQKVVEPALAFAKRYGGAAYGSLNEVFSKVKGEHAGPAAGGMAKGGRAGTGGANFGGHPTNVTGPVRNLIALMQKRWPALAVTSTTDHSVNSSSGGRSYHTDGKAVDLATADYGYMNKAAAWVKSSGLYKKLAEGIHNPNLAVKNGALVNGPSFYSAGGVWGQHLNHIHMAILGGIGKLAGGAGGAAKVKKQIVGGSGGMKTIVQGAIDKATKAANVKVDKESAKSGGGDTGFLSTRFKDGVLTVEQVKSIIHKAEQMLDIPNAIRSRWTSMALRQASRESGFNPNSINKTDINAQRGDPSRGLFQTIGATFNQYKYKGYDNIYGPLDSALAAFRYMKATYGGGDWQRALSVMTSRGGGAYAKGGFVKAIAQMMGGAFAEGGVVPGALGQAVPILAHAKEWVVNERQQHKLASWMGTTKDKVAGALGFGHNTKTSAATGTKVSKTTSVSKSVVERADKIEKKLKDFEIPDIYSTTVGNLTALSGQARKALRKMQLRSSKFLDDFKSTFDDLAGDDGLLDQLSEAVTARADKLARALATSTYKITRKTGAIVKTLDDVAVSDKTLDNLVKEYKDLVGEKGVIQGTMSNIAARIKRLRKGGIKDDEKSSYTYLIGYQRNLQKRLDAVQDGINENVASRYEQITNSIDARTAKANDTASSKTARVDVQERLNAIVGGTRLGLTAGAAGAQRADIINEQIAGLQDAQKFAKKKGRKTEASDIQTQIDDLRAQAQEAVAAGLQADVDEIQRQSTRRSNASDLKSRIGSALGRVDLVAQANAEKLGENTSLIAQLQAKQRDAAAKGLGTLAESIGDQIAELQTSSAELAATMLQNAIDQVNNAASRRMSQLDVLGRGADLLERAGGYEGAFAQRAGILGQRRDVLTSQRDQLSSLAAQAAAAGNQGQYEALTDQIADLNMQLAENADATSSNTVQLRQARIDAITGRGSFQGGVFNNISSLLDALGTLGGTTDTASKIALARRAGTTLTETLNGGNGLPGLASQLSDITGGRLNVGGMNPTQIASLLGSVNYDQMESGFTKEQKDQFEALINAVIDNATATVQNTDQLKNLTGTTTQTWSSAAWQWFRQAVYNGNGGLLAQYQNPSLGIVNPSGDPYSSRTTAAVADGAMGTGSTTYNNTVENHEKTVDMNAEEVSNKLYWRQKTGSRG